MFVNATEDEWDAVVRVHLKGHFCVVALGRRVLAGRGRRRGDAVDARIINTSSGAGLMGSVGQAAYSAAKAGIAGLTLVQAAELGRYGITANAIAPSARTRMTETVFADMMAAPTEDVGRVRRDGARERRRRSWCGSGRRCRGTSPAGCSRSRAARCPSPTAGSTEP